MKNLLLSTASSIVFSALLMASTPAMAAQATIMPIAPSPTTVAKPPTAEEIDTYIKANIGNPAAIADAMAHYHVDLNRIQAATGYSTQQITDYIHTSGNAQLKSSLASWNPTAAGGSNGNTPISPVAPAPVTSAPAPVPVTPLRPVPVPVGPVGIDPKPALPPTSAEIDSFIKANINNPASIADAMEKYSVNLDRIQSATGYTREQMTNYIANSDNAKLKAAAGNWTPTGPVTGGGSDYVVNDTEIDQYIKANINDPAKIAAAMKKHSIGLDRIQEATGYTVDQMRNYINNSGNSELKTALGVWPKAINTPPNVHTAPAVSDAEINAYIKANINSPTAIIVGMTRYNVSLNRIQSVMGYSTQQMMDYINKSGNGLQPR